MDSKGKKNLIMTLLLVAYILLGIFLCFTIFLNKCLHLHGLISLIATLFIGIGIILYRILISLRTRTVKYLHMLIHTIVIVLLVGASFLTFHDDDMPNVHAYISYMMLGIMIGQYIVAIIVFVILRSHRLRINAATYHDVCGIWIFICLVACCLTGNYPLVATDFNNWKETFYMCGYVAFIIIVGIGLCPYFEWELNGRI